MKNIRMFYLKICHFLVVKFSVYLNRHVFVMMAAFKMCKLLARTLPWIPAPVGACHIGTGIQTQNIRYHCTFECSTVHNRFGLVWSLTTQSTL